MFEVEAALEVEARQALLPQDDGMTSMTSMTFQKGALRTTNQALSAGEVAAALLMAPILSPTNVTWLHSVGLSADC